LDSPAGSPKREITRYALHREAATPEEKAIGHAQTQSSSRVLLLVDTAGAFGRGIVEGVGRYSQENGPWSIQFEYRALDRCRRSG